jgi:hypothetical protein
MNTNTISRLRRRRSPISAQRLERSDNPGDKLKQYVLEPCKGYPRTCVTLSGLTGILSMDTPGLSLALQPLG